MSLTVPLLTVSRKLAVTNVLMTNSHAGISEPVAVTELAKTRSSTLAANRQLSSSPLPPLSDSDYDPAANEHNPACIVQKTIDSDSSYDYSFINTKPRSMSTKSTAEVTHTTASKPPCLSAGTISPEVLHQFENACHSFFHNKEGLEPKDHIARIAGSLQDPLLADWYWTGQETFDALSFNDFMKEFRNKWLPNNWEQDIRHKVLGTKQSGAFWDWAVKMRSLNTLLHGTTNHLDDAALLNQLKANLEPWLSCACDDERIKEDTLDKWLDKVKIVDKKKCRERQQQRADAEEATCSHLKRNTTRLQGCPNRRVATTLSVEAQRTIKPPAVAGNPLTLPKACRNSPMRSGLSCSTTKDVSSAIAFSSPTIPRTV
jgi:hypothetical protein